MKRTIYRALSFLLCLSLLFIGSVPVSAAEGEISRISCTVNGDPSTQRGFCWFTPEETPTEIKLFDAGGRDITDSLQIETSREEWQGSYSHKAVVGGLTPGNEYTYTVGGGGAWSDTGSFKTDDGDDSVNFIVTADVQASSPENFQSAARVTNEAFNVMPQADFYVNLGDFTNDCTNEEWDCYSAAFDEINTNTTLVPVTGNHDNEKGWFNSLFSLDTTQAVQTKTGVNYSFEYGNVHFSVVNTSDIISISRSQLNWLKNDLSSTNCDWKIVMLHKSPYSLGKDIKWPDSAYLQKILTEICDETGVDLVLSGHDHMYLRTKPLTANTLAKGGTTYVLAGTAGTKRYEIRPFLLNNLISPEIIDACVVQKSGYGNYFDGVDFESADEENIGGCFNTLSVSGGELTLNAYILSDSTGGVKQIDSLTLTKETGQNTATFSGDNTTPPSIYAMNSIPTILDLAVYAFTDWLPKFIKMIPDIISTYMATGTF